MQASCPGQDKQVQPIGSDRPRKVDFRLITATGKKATIITTNLSFDRWGEIVKDKVLVAAMVDRLTHKAHLVNMSGQSYRVKETQNMRRYVSQK